MEVLRDGRSALYGWEMYGVYRAVSNGTQKLPIVRKAKFANSKSNVHKIGKSFPTPKEQRMTSDLKQIDERY